MNVKGNDRKQSINSIHLKRQGTAKMDRVKMLSIFGVISSALGVACWLLAHITSITSIYSLSLSSAAFFVSILGLVSNVIALVMRKQSSDADNVLKIGTIGLALNVLLPILAIFPNGTLG